MTQYINVLQYPVHKYLYIHVHTYLCLYIHMYVAITITHVFLAHLRTTQNYLLQGHFKSATALFCVHTDVSGGEGFKAAGAYLVVTRM